MTVATVPVIPGPASGPGMSESAGPAITLSWDELDREIRQAERTGLCTRPVRLTGRIDAIDLATGELATMYDTATEPGGVLLTACGNRREAVCPPCSAGLQTRRPPARPRRPGRRQRRARDHRRAPLRVRHVHRALSFGPVHSRRMRGKTVLPCRPRRDAKQRRCPHGRDISCPRRHPDDDPRLGRPLCPDCYDYTAAVLFNAHAGQPVATVRHLPAPPPGPARRAHPESSSARSRSSGTSRSAEYQARGVIHYHAIIRLDAPGESYQPPPPWLGTALLCDAIISAAAAVTVEVDGPDGAAVHAAVRRPGRPPAHPPR